MTSDRINPLLRTSQGSSIQRNAKKGGKLDEFWLSWRVVSRLRLRSSMKKKIRVTPVPLTIPIAATTQQTLEFPLNPTP